MKKIISVLLILAMACSMICVVSAEEEKFATINLVQFDKKPIFDGKVSNAEWGQPVAEANMKNQVCYANAATPEVSFNIWMGYDFQGLYLAVRAKDSAHINSALPDNPSKMYNGDCLQMRLDEHGCTVDRGKIPGGRDSNWSSDYAEFAFAMDAAGNTYSHAWHGISKGQALEAGDGKYTSSNDGQYTTYELYIPWENIVSDAPHVGTTHGMSIGMFNFVGATSNYMEWGSGVFNFANRDGVNMYGSNRLVYTDKTLTGGPSLVDPDGDEKPVTLPPVENAEGDYIVFELDGFEGAKDLGWDYVEDEGYADIAYAGSDAYIIYSVDSFWKASADEYKYLAIYCKTNTSDNAGRIYFTTPAAASFAQPNSQEFYFEPTEEKQIVVVDMSLNPYWTEQIGRVRFDFVNPEGNNSPIGALEDFTTEIYGIALFKNEADAKAFKVDGVSVDVPTEPETSAPVEDTTVPDTDADTTTPEEKDDTTVAPATPDTTTSTDDGDNNTTTIIIIIVACVLVAAAGVGVFFFIKKKKA